MDPNLADDLERLVDRHGLDRVLEALGSVCNDKAEHLLTNWADAPTAKLWERCAAEIGVMVVSARMVSPNL